MYNNDFFKLFDIEVKFINELIRFKLCFNFFCLKIVCVKCISRVLFLKYELLSVLLEIFFFYLFPPFHGTYKYIIYYKYNEYQTVFLVNSRKVLTIIITMIPRVDYVTYIYDKILFGS